MWQIHCNFKASVSNWMINSYVSQPVGRTHSYSLRFMYCEKYFSVLQGGRDMRTDVSLSFYVISSGREVWMLAGRVVRTWETRNTHKILVEKSEEDCRVRKTYMEGEQNMDWTGSDYDQICGLCKHGASAHLSRDLLIQSAELFMTYSFTSGVKQSPFCKSVSSPDTFV